MAGLAGQVSAHSEANQVVCVRKRMSLVEVVDAPDEAAFGIAPGAEGFHVEVANGQHLRRSGQFRANLWPQLRPAIKSGTEKRKDRCFHILVLFAEIFR